MSTVEIRAGSQICKGQPRMSGRHLRMNVFLWFRRNFASIHGFVKFGQAGRGLGVGRKGGFVFAAKKSRKHWVEWFPMLVLWGILAGLAGGLAIGLVTTRTTSVPSTAQ
jgi:hypothetical protein